ncbi:MAG TPA: carboxypeptidase-like regulatory domain-containing protein, partial [Flavisolibacter sp.]|nr:carboxypeptidase-like regulatory domain-containing protein [Flavisolibacter sp.]
MKIGYCLLMALVFFFYQVHSQVTNHTVTGTVTDSATHTPVENVSVMLKNTKTGTVTNVHGKFSLTTNTGAGVLVFSRIGYKPEEVSINSSAVINVSLAENTNSMNDVVVVGYIQQSTKKNTASVSKLNVSELRNNPNPNPVQALQGKIAGVSVPISQGQPGIGAVNIIIRGGTKPNVYGSGLGTNNGSAT